MTYIIKVDVGWDSNNTVVTAVFTAVMGTIVAVVPWESG